MNRLLVVATLSLTMFACAVGVDEPLPAPPAEEPQREPPQRSLSGSLEDPFANLVVKPSEYQHPPEVRPLQAPPMPGR